MLWFYEFFFPAVWIAFFLYWQIKAANTKTTQRLEPRASRILREWMRSQFGETYASYAHHTALLVPYVF
jgi:hypothetical protein